MSFRFANGNFLFRIVARGRFSVHAINPRNDFFLLNARNFEYIKKSRVFFGKTTIILMKVTNVRLVTFGRLKQT